jgi:hypothetical protein
MLQNLQVPNREYLEECHSHVLLAKAHSRKDNSFDDEKKS